MPRNRAGVREAAQAQSWARREEALLSKEGLLRERET